MESLTQQDSHTDRLEFWKKEAAHYKNKTNEIQQELDEYTENSAQLEKELETSLEQAEKQNRDLRHENQRFQNEIEALRHKLDRSQHESNSLERELQALKLEKEKQNVYIRELEQKNDDLERGQRIISESVSYVEALLNQAYERNAVLESEIDEKEYLKIELQRVADEARDLKQELKVKERVPHCKKENDSANENASINAHLLNACAQVETETQTLPITPHKREINGNALPPSARVTAINIVGDLLRKVGLERFLCRECGKVKCSCNSPTTLTTEHVTHEMPSSCFGYTGPPEMSAEDLEYDPVQYRANRVLARQNSDTNSDVDIRIQTPGRLSYRKSEQAFERSSENGGLRKSFAVRSRESIENILSFTSIRKSQETNKKIKVHKPDK